MDQVFGDVLEGLTSGLRASESEVLDIQRRDDGSIKADYGDEEVFFVVTVRQVRRDNPDAPLHALPS
jgi:hypothetical protein